MQRITFYVGTGFDKNGNAIPAEDAVIALALIRAGLAGAYGGYSETQARGGWINGQGDLVEETAHVFVVVAADTVAPLSMAEAMAKALNQESVLVTQESVAAAFIGQRENA